MYFKAELESIDFFPIEDLQTCVAKRPASRLKQVHFIIVSYDSKRKIILRLTNFEELVVHYMNLLMIISDFTDSIPLNKPKIK